MVTNQEECNYKSTDQTSVKSVTLNSNLLISSAPPDPNPDPKPPDPPPMPPIPGSNKIPYNVWKFLKKAIRWIRRNKIIGPQL